MKGMEMKEVEIKKMRMFKKDVQKRKIIWRGIIKGLGIGLVFVKIRKIKFVKMKEEMKKKGKGFLRIMRNVG